MVRGQVACQGKYQKKEERNKKNSDRKQTKLNAPHVMCNGKILSQ